MPTEMWSENLKGKVNFRELEVDERMKLNFILKKYHAKS